MERIKRSDLKLYFSIILPHFTRHNEVYYFVITRKMIEPSGSISRHTSFDEIIVQGGGVFEVESDAGGLSVFCNRLVINSGGVFQVTRLDLTANFVRIEQSGILQANYKVTIVTTMQLNKYRIVCARNYTFSCHCPFKTPLVLKIIFGNYFSRLTN